ncbi:MAG TPA: FAD-dependent oxidoreductase [Candidatus Limnocylindrales bacterium]|nr:FAD-dependent oxidoreductase [Candidatus Limnocylindrales bacterium]
MSTLHQPRVDPPFHLRTGPPPDTADVVVVGAGVIGCATAFFTTAAGLRTIVLDARPQPATLTTAAATGAYRLQHDNLEELTLVREGVDLLYAFPERTGLPGYDIRLRPQGYLFCTTEQDALDRQRRMVERQHGFGLADVELLSGDEARARFAHIGPDVLGARYRAGDGFIDQVRVALGYALAASNGPSVERPAGTATATFCLGERATGLRVVGNRVVAVETRHAAIAAPIVILATGPFLAQTAALAGLAIELQPTIRQKVLVADLPAVPADAPMTIDEETGAHWRPWLHGALVLQTDPSTHPSAPSWSPAGSADAGFRLLDPASPASVARISPFWAEAWRSGGVSFTVQAGQYEITPDHRPYVSPTAVRGLWLNGGYSGHGVMGSAGGSRLLVDLFTGRATGPTDGLRADPDGYSPFRVDRPFIERERDVL